MLKMRTVVLIWWTTERQDEVDSKYGLYGQHSGCTVAIFYRHGNFCSKESSNIVCSNTHMDLKLTRMSIAPKMSRDANGDAGNNPN